MSFEWFVALRFLREGRFQTLLIIGGVGVGVGVIVFLSALISGLQASLIERTLGTQAHIVVRPNDEEPRPIASQGRGDVVAQIVRPAQRVRSIIAWQQVEATIERTPGVVASAPTVAGSAFAIRGNASRSIAVRGVEAPGYLRIVDMERHMSAGRFALTGSQAVIGVELARDLGVGVGETIRLEPAAERGGPFTVTGIFDVGNKDLNQRWVFVSLRAAQNLFDLPGGVSTIEIKVERLFEAEGIAVRLAERTCLTADSWMKINAQLLIGLRSQSSSSYMIQFFVVVAVAFGIASVLAVSVTQKSREIGILKAMGAKTARVLRVFLIQGGLVGLIGSFLGIAIGISLSLFFASLARNPDGSPTFPVDLNLFLYLRTACVATLTGLLAAVLPARRAARLDPVEVIRYG
ncbi:MAG: ABC transporter permease [Vicinamibacteria bacterium]|jgi:lipoprotein-releasing system permease protein|nr:ABC transporter permease [Vicinamibacteria bacterium]